MTWMTGNLHGSPSPASMSIFNMTQSSGITLSWNYGTLRCHQMLPENPRSKKMEVSSFKENIIYISYIMLQYIYIYIDMDFRLPCLITGWSIWNSYNDSVKIGWWAIDPVGWPSMSFPFKFNFPINIYIYTHIIYMYNIDIYIICIYIYIW